jgi:hypothetical protein
MKILLEQPARSRFISGAENLVKVDKTVLSDLYFWFPNEDLYPLALYCIMEALDGANKQLNSSVSQIVCSGRSLDLLLCRQAHKRI